MRDWKRSLGLVATTALVIGACGGGGGTATQRPSTSASTAPSTAASSAPSAAASAAASNGSLTAVSLQLQWEPQAQFAGYFAADREGYYAEEGLDVEMLRGGAEILPHVVGSEPNGPEFTISWVPKVLQVRAKDQSDLVNIAQVFQRSGTRSVSWVAGKGPGTPSDEDITSPEQYAGKNVGVWDYGNEYEVTAAALLHDLVANEDYTRIVQPFNMDLLFNREVDVAEAMIYNEYAQVLEAEDPATGGLYQRSDIKVIDYNEVGTAMLQDAIFAREAWLAEAGNEDVAVRFLRASFRGWIFCRENAEKCIEYTVDAGSTLGAGHQAWMMNEINPLIWPTPNGIGSMNGDEWAQTVRVSVEAGIIPSDPEQGAFRSDLALAARQDITEDAVGDGFVKGEVDVTPGGE